MLTRIQLKAILIICGVGIDQVAIVSAYPGKPSYSAPSSSASDAPTLEPTAELSSKWNNPFWLMNIPPPKKKSPPKPKEKPPPEVANAEWYYYKSQDATLVGGKRGLSKDQLAEIDWNRQFSIEEWKDMILDGLTEDQLPHKAQAHEIYWVIFNMLWEDRMRNLTAPLEEAGLWPTKNYTVPKLPPTQKTVPVVTRPGLVPLPEDELAAVNWDRELSIEDWKRLILHGLTEDQLPHKKNVHEIYWVIYNMMWEDTMRKFTAFLDVAAKPENNASSSAKTGNYTNNLLRRGFSLNRDSATPQSKLSARADQNWLNHINFDHIQAMMLSKMQSFNVNETRVRVWNDTNKHWVDFPASSADWARLDTSDMKQLISRGLTPMELPRDDHVAHKYYKAMLESSCDELFNITGDSHDALMKRQSLESFTSSLTTTEAPEPLVTGTGILWWVAFAVGATGFTTWALLKLKKHNSIGPRDDSVARKYYKATHESNVTGDGHHALVKRQSELSSPGASEILGQPFDMPEPRVSASTLVWMLVIVGVIGTVTPWVVSKLKTSKFIGPRDMDMLTLTGDAGSVLEWANTTTYAVADTTVDLMCMLLGKDCPSVARHDGFDPDFARMTRDGLERGAVVFKQHPRLAHACYSLSQHWINSRNGDSLELTKAKVAYGAHKISRLYLELTRGDNTTTFATEAPTASSETNAVKETGTTSTGNTTTTTTAATTQLNEEELQKRQWNIHWCNPYGYACASDNGCCHGGYCRMHKNSKPWVGSRTWICTWDSLGHEFPDYVNQEPFKV